MSSETIVSALFLISAVVAAGVLISAILPTIYRTSETFGSVSHEADKHIRTDIKIVNTFVREDRSKAQIWLKNVGSTPISNKELSESDIFLGAPEDFSKYSLTDYLIGDDEADTWWDPGETLTINATSGVPESGEVYFSIVLPDGTKREEVFT